MPQDYVIPANSIKVNGVPLRHEWEAAPGSAILPGDIVEFDTNYCTGGHSKIKECAANSEFAVGVAEVEPLNEKTDAYDASDQVRVLSGNIVVALRLAAGNAVTCGMNLKPAASGEVAVLDCEAGTNDVNSNACLRVAQALESHASATVMVWLVCKLLI
jgi:hypothetical protein